MYFVYILKNGQGRHYIGSCENLSRRLKEHNSNWVNSTKNKGPFVIVYKEEFTNRTDARKRENEIKSYKGNSKFAKLVKGSDPVV